MYLFHKVLRTNMDYFYTQHWLTGFYNRKGVRLMGGKKMNI